jgi:hypothetical protein
MSVGLNSPLDEVYAFTNFELCCLDLISIRQKEEGV